MVEKVGTINYSDLPALDPETSANMKTELSISLILSIVYYVFILGVTILNWTSPGLMKTILWGGMSLTWFLTSIMAMIMAAFVAWLHLYFYQQRVAKQASSENNKAMEVL